MREVARLAGLPLRAIQRELALYQRCGLVVRRQRGRQVFVGIARTHPLIAPLRDLFSAAAALSVPPDGAETQRSPDRSSPGQPAVGTAPGRPGKDRSWRVW
jgi:hypothetical protein